VVHSELIRERLAADATLACLHCAAVAFDHGLVLLTGNYNAGKSTLAVHLAAAGHRLYCDDILPIEASRGLGIAPGFLPRLRLPLPVDVSSWFRDFVAERMGPGGQYSLYVALCDDEIEPLGTMAPICAVVQLERHEEGPPALVPTPRSEILHSLLKRNIARDLPSLDLLDRLHPIVEEAACFTLHYGGCEEAVALLERAFGSGGARRSAA
jgi:hypothetical protein